MDVEVVSGTAEAGTALGAFDAALGAAGVGDYNLLRLSSVVPPGAAVVRTGTHDGRHGVGAPVACVLAEARSATAGETLAAGLGWATAEEGGVFMEATATSRAACEAAIADRLDDARAARDWAWDGGDERVVETHTVEDAGAAVVAAVYGPLAFERRNR